MVCLLSFFLVQGLVDELVWYQRSVGAGSGLFCSQPCNYSVAFLIRCIIRTRQDRLAVS